MTWDSRCFKRFSNLRQGGITVKADSTIQETQNVHPKEAQEFLKSRFRNQLKDYIRVKFQSLVKSQHDRGRVSNFRCVLAEESTIGVVRTEQGDIWRSYRKVSICFHHSQSKTNKWMRRN
jgi:hypothetical protein